MGQYVSEIVFYKIVGQVQTKLWKWKNDPINKPRNEEYGSDP